MSFKLIWASLEVNDQHFPNLFKRKKKRLLILRFSRPILCLIHGKCIHFEIRNDSFQGWACTHCHTGVSYWVCLLREECSTWVSRRADTHNAQLSGLDVDRKFTLPAQPRSPTSTSTNESTRQSKISHGRNTDSVRISVVSYNKYLLKNITTWSSSYFSL